MALLLHIFDVAITVRVFRSNWIRRERQPFFFFSHSPWGRGKHEKFIGKLDEAFLIILLTFQLLARRNAPFLDSLFSRNCENLFATAKRLISCARQTSCMCVILVPFHVWKPFVDGLGGICWRLMYYLCVCCRRTYANRYKIGVNLSSGLSWIFNTLICIRRYD